MGRSDEGERRDYDLAPHSRGANGDLQGDRAVAHRYAVADAEKIGHFGFEFLDKRPVVGKPPAVQHLVDPRQEALAVADLGPADVDGRIEQGRSTEHGEL